MLRQRSSRGTLFYNRSFSVFLRAFVVTCELQICQKLIFNQHSDRVVYRIVLRCTPTDHTVLIVGRFRLYFISYSALASHFSKHSQTTNYALCVSLCYFCLTFLRYRYVMYFIQAEKIHVSRMISIYI